LKVIVLNWPLLVHTYTRWYCLKTSKRRLWSKFFHRRIALLY